MNIILYVGELSNFDQKKKIVALKGKKSACVCVCIYIFITIC